MATRERWRGRLRDLEAQRGPLSGILTGLLNVAAELGQTGLSAEETARLRASVYCLSVAAHVCELAMLDAKLDALNEKLDGVASTGRLLHGRWGGGYPHEA